MIVVIADMQAPMRDIPDSAGSVALSGSQAGIEFDNMLNHNADAPQSAPVALPSLMAQLTPIPADAKKALAELEGFVFYARKHGNPELKSLARKFEPELNLIKSNLYSDNYWKHTDSINKLKATEGKAGMGAKIHFVFSVHDFFGMVRGVPSQQQIDQAYHQLIKQLKIR